MENVKTKLDTFYLAETRQESHGDSVSLSVPLPLALFLESLSTGVSAESLFPYISPQVGGKYGIGKHV